MPDVDVSQAATTVTVGDPVPDPPDAADVAAARAAVAAATTVAALRTRTIALFDLLNTQENP